MAAEGIEDLEYYEEYKILSILLIARCMNFFFNANLILAFYVNLMPIEYDHHVIFLMRRDSKLVDISYLGFGGTKS